MRGHLFAILAALSLALCLASAALWVRTGWRRDEHQMASRKDAFATSAHRVWWVHASRPYWAGIPYHSEPAHGSFADQFGWGVAPPPYPPAVQARGGVFLGFVYVSYVQTNVTPSCAFTYVGVPMWFLVVATAVLPAVWFRRRRAARRPPRLCPNCGYDLRATPDRCPECGAAPDATAPPPRESA